MDCELLLVSGDPQNMNVYIAMCYDCEFLAICHGNDFPFLHILGFGVFICTDFIFMFLFRLALVRNFSLGS